MNTEKIGKYIKQLRQKNNLTQEELATKIFVTNKAISRWETGKSLPEIETLYLLSKELNVSVNDILEAGDNSKEDVKKYFDKKKIKNIIIDLILFVLVGFIAIYFIYDASSFFTGYLVTSINQNKEITLELLKDTMNMSLQSINSFILYYIIILISYLFFKNRNSKGLIIIIVIFIINYLSGIDFTNLTINNIFSFKLIDLLFTIFVILELILCKIIRDDE